MSRDVDDGTSSCSSGDDIVMPSSTALFDFDPDVNLHVAVSLEYAQASLGPAPESLHPIAPTEWVCLGCYAVGILNPAQQHAQSRLARDLLAHHAILPDRDGHRPVQLVMTHMVSWQHLEAFKALLRDTTTEVQTVYGGYTRVHLNESTAVRNANSHALCAVVVHVDRVHNLIAWLCCGRNGQIKLVSTPPATSVSCDDLLLEECGDDLMWVEFDKLNESSPPFDATSPLKRTQSPTAVDLLEELWTSSDDYVVLPPLPSLTPLVSSPPQHHEVVHRMPTSHCMEDFSTHSFSTQQLAPMEIATFVDEHGCPQQFKTLYSRNNKKGGIRNLRCFPNCKRGHHSTTSFCGTNLRVQFHPDHSMPTSLAHATITAFARFRNFLEPCEEYSPGMVVPQASIYRELRSKENPKAIWFQTKCVSPMLFEIRPSGRSLSWHYGFHGATLHKTMTHCIEVVFFTCERDSAAPFQCIGTVQSPRFRIISSRSREP